MTVLATDNLPLVSCAPNGIAKLRTLFLELAVRGKLVPQDSCDEPAASLLLRIQSEKSRQSVKRATKKANALAEPYTGEPPSNLPSGWAVVRLGELVSISTGKLDANAAVADGAYPFFTCSQTPSRIDRYSFDCPAVLLAGNGDFNLKKYTGKFDAYQRTYVIEPILWSLDYCFISLRAEIERITENNRGSAIPYLKLGDITTPKIWVPPLAEQHRIVAKVDELMALCDRLEAEQADAEAAHAKLAEALLASLTQARDAADLRASWQQLAEHFHTLFTTEASVEALKQAVLRLGVMGKLVSQVEAEGDSRSILQQVQAIQSAKARRRTRAASSIEVTQPPFTIPKQWAWCELQDVFDVRDGTHDTPRYQSEGVPLVTSKNLSSGRLDLQDVKLISFDDHRKISERSKVDAGDVLFAMIGSIGNPVLVDTEREFSIKNVALFKPYGQDLPSSEYLLIYLTSVASDMRERSAGGVQSFVSLGSLRSYPFALPPVQEQERIVAKVNELISLCEQLKLSLAKARQHHEHLASILVGQAVA